MKYPNKYVRINLAMNVAAGLVNTFSQLGHRGSNWTLEETMPKLIKSHIETQAFLYGIPKKHNAHMIDAAMEFYNRHLKSVLKEIVERQESQILK
jgi:hypothetical protein